MATSNGGQQKQLLHLVFGGELKSVDSMEFKDVGALDVVGIYPNYAAAYDAWKGAAQRTVDNALMRYFIVHMHRLLDPNDAAVHSRHLSEDERAPRKQEAF